MEFKAKTSEYLAKSQMSNRIKYNDTFTRSRRLQFQWIIWVLPGLSELNRQFMSFPDCILCTWVPRLILTVVSGCWEATEN